MIVKYMIFENNITKESDLIKIEGESDAIYLFIFIYIITIIIMV